MAEDFSADGMLDMYLYENGQLLEQLEATTLEKKDADSFDEADINEFFRVMHTIKGSSGIMMFDDIMKLAHKLEVLFYQGIQAGQRSAHGAGRTHFSGVGFYIGRI